MIDIDLLRICRSRKDYYKLRPLIIDTGMDAKTVAIAQDFGRYFDAFQDQDLIDMVSFIPRFRGWHPTLEDDQMGPYNAIFRQLTKEPSESIREGIMAELFEQRLATKLANLVAQYSDGECPDFTNKITLANDEYHMDMGTREVSWVDMSDVAGMFEREIKDGIKWRLNCLNETMRPLLPGDFGIVAARPDAGKTSFLCSEATFMAPQLKPDRNIIWLNNEGKAENLRPRLYQAALDLTLTELAAIDRVKLVDMYRTAMTRLDKIKPVDIHGWHIGQVENLLDNFEPGLVIFDMIDHIKGFGSEARTDLALEEMYKWARERCVKYDFAGLATSQISNEGDGLLYPTLGMLKDSKTGKQGACDFQLMIGRPNDASLREFARYISLPKNKLRRDGAAADPRAEVQFKPSKARYEDEPDILPQHPSNGN